VAVVHREKELRMAKPRNTVPAVGELAECLEHSTLSLRHQARRGDVPGQKVGRHWRFHKIAIDEWVKRGLPANDKGRDE